MQIDTWHREKMDISGDMPPPFVAGPQPRAAGAARVRHVAPPHVVHRDVLGAPSAHDRKVRVEELIRWAVW